MIIDLIDSNLMYYNTNGLNVGVYYVMLMTTEPKSAKKHGSKNKRTILRQKMK